MTGCYETATEAAATFDALAASRARSDLYLSAKLNKAAFHPALRGRADKPTFSQSAIVIIADAGAAAIGRENGIAPVALSVAVEMAAKDRLHVQSIKTLQDGIRV